MEERKSKRTSRGRSKTMRNKKTNVKSKITTDFKLGKNKKMDVITIVDYTFLISLILSIIFGMQTNPGFLLPFTITLVITLVCMGIILVNSIYRKIKKKIMKKGN